MVLFFPWTLLSPPPPTFFLKFVSPRMAPPVSPLVGGLWVAMRLAQWDSQVPWATANSRFLDALGEGREGSVEKSEKTRPRTRCLKWLGGWSFGVSVSFFIFFFWVRKTWSNVMITLSGTTLFERRGVSFQFFGRFGWRSSITVVSLFVWDVKFMLPLSRTSTFRIFCCQSQFLHGSFPKNLAKSQHLPQKTSQNLKTKSRDSGVS